jgi:hypothetical protein
MKKKNPLTLLVGGMLLVVFLALLFCFQVRTTEVAVVRGVSLSDLMGRASLAVANAFRSSEWVRVEVINVQARNHVYLELAERDATGQVRPADDGDAVRGGHDLVQLGALDIAPRFDRQIDDD